MRRLRSTIGMTALVGLTAVSILLASVAPVVPSWPADVSAEKTGTAVGEAVDAALEHAAASSPTSLDGLLAAFVHAYAEQQPDSDDALETEATGSMDAGDIFNVFWQGHRTALTRMLAGSASSASVPLTLSRGDAAVLHGEASLTGVQFLSRSCALRLVSFVLSIRSVWSAEPLGP